MIPPSKPADEATRLADLHALAVLDTPAEERFDRLTRIARILFDAPMALVSLVDGDRQWVKSGVGIPTHETSRETSFCGHAILSDEVMVVPDTAEDPRFHDNPLVTGEPHVRFYVGRPLKVAGRSKVGTLCLMDSRPRQFSEHERRLLEDLASMAEQELTAVSMATTDRLTGLLNRQGFELLASQSLRVCQRMKRPASLLFFDMDRFKQINDQFGHEEGDRALKTFASLLTNSFRGSDLIARLGGDEFVALLIDSPTEGLSEALSRFRKRLADEGGHDGPPYELRCSIGCAEYDPASEPSLTVLMAAADQQMYRDKAARR